jgi:hypothetical protein
MWLAHVDACTSLAIIKIINPLLKNVFSNQEIINQKENLSLIGMKTPRN